MLNEARLNVMPLFLNSSFTNFSHRKARDRTEKVLVAPKGRIFGVTFWFAKCILNLSSKIALVKFPSALPHASGGAGVLCDVSFVLGSRFLSAI